MSILKVCNVCFVCFVLRLSTFLLFVDLSLNLWTFFCLSTQGTQRKNEVHRVWPNPCSTVESLVLPVSVFVCYLLFFSTETDQFPTTFPVKSFYLLKVCYWLRRLGWFVRLFWRRSTDRVVVFDSVLGLESVSFLGTGCCSPQSSLV